MCDRPLRRVTTRPQTVRGGNNPGDQKRVKAVGDGGARGVSRRFERSGRSARASCSAGASLAMRADVCAACAVGCKGVNHVLANEYQAGVGILPHKVHNKRASTRQPTHLDDSAPRTWLLLIHMLQGCTAG